MQPTTPQRQKWNGWQLDKRCIYYHRTTFGQKVVPRNARLCEVSPNMTKGENALKTKTYRHLPTYEKIVGKFA
jgi:hypothetical protein